jgi:DNA-binding XRE family transcriptional regulator
MSRRNLTLKLLRIIGSPFTHEWECPASRSEALELYKYAIKNKIGFTYMKSLKKLELLKKLGFEAEYEKEQEKYKEQLSTAIRISKILDSLNVDHVIFKSIMPFPAIQNDIDIIIFGSDDDYRILIERMIEYGYIDLRKLYADNLRNKQDPLTHPFHDARSNMHKNLSVKDVYDFDLYQEVSLMDYIVYLDKRIFQNFVTTMNILNHQIKVLKPEAELTAIIAHSALKEQIFTLHTYYAVLHHLAKMDSKQIKDFIAIVERSNIITSVRACCSMTAELHDFAYNFYPEKLWDIIAILGYERREMEKLIKKDLEMPYHYSLSLIMKAFLEIAKDRMVQKSIARQVKGLINPTGIKRALTGLICLRTRDTY